MISDLLVFVIIVECDRMAICVQSQLFQHCRPVKDGLSNKYSIDRPNTPSGYDVTLRRQFERANTIPLIILKL